MIYFLVHVMIDWFIWFNSGKLDYYNTIYNKNTEKLGYCQVSVERKLYLVHNPKPKNSKQIYYWLIEQVTFIYITKHVSCTVSKK